MPIHRVVVALALAMLPAFSLAGGAPFAVAQEAGAGLTGEGTYASPLYGYEVTWEASWSADPAQTITGAGTGTSDLLTLSKGASALRVEGFVDESGLDDPLADREYVATLFDLIVDALGTSCVAPACEATVIASEADASPPTLTYDLAVQGTELRAVTALATTEIGADRIVFAEVLIAFPDDLDAVLADAQGTVVVAGRPFLEGAEPVDGGATPVASPVAAGATADARGGGGAAARG